MANAFGKEIRQMSKEWQLILIVGGILLIPFMLYGVLLLQERWNK